MSLDKSTLNTSLEHVPPLIQAEIETAVEIVHQVGKKDVAMIWLFGSYSRGDFINDRRVDDNGLVSEYNSDVDILVILRGKDSKKKHKLLHKLVHDVQEHPALTAPFHVIYETLERFNQSLSGSEYFYLDVIKEGVVLFDDEVTLAQPQPLSAEQRRKMSIRYFERFYRKAIESQQSFQLHYPRDMSAFAIFNLHQMAERLFYAYLLVLTHYKPRTHKLVELRGQTKKLNQEIKKIFPLETKQQKQRFGFFCDAYVDSRYQPDYTVEIEVLDTIAGWVEDLQRWVFAESLKAIDGFVPKHNYSHQCSLQHPFLDLAKIKSTPLAEDVLVQKEQALKKAEAREKEAIKREEEGLAREALKDKEQERLRELLHKAGIDPD
ncbi:MAG: HEPN domain-containing protein [Pseudomonadales bacterium]